MGRVLEIYAATTLWRRQVSAIFESFGFVNIAEFGARGDGITNDTAAFNLALLDGRPIALDASKTYAITDLRITPNTECPGIFCMGGQARLVPASTADVRMILITKPADFFLENLFFDLPISTDPVNPPACGRALEYFPTGLTGTNYRIENCRFSGGTLGVTMIGCIVTASRVAGNYFTGTWAEGFAANCIKRFEIVDNIFDDGGFATGVKQPSGAMRIGSSIQLDSSLDVLISRNMISRYCVPAIQSAIDCFSGSASGIRISDNICQDNGSGIEFKTLPWVIGSPDVYEDNAIEDNTIRLLSGVVTGGITMFHAQPGAPAGKARKGKLSGNLISCATPPASGATHYGISISGHDDMTIDGNTILNVGQGIAVSGAGPTGDTARNIVISGNTVDAVDAAISRVGGTDTIDGLYIRGNPLLRCSATGAKAVIITAGTIDLEVSDNRIESLAGSALEIRDTVGGRVLDNTLIGSISAVIMQNTASSAIVIRDNDLTAATGPACNLSLGSAIEVQGNDVTVPIGSRTVSGAATYTAAGNIRGMASANPTGTAGGSLGDIFLDDTAATAGWRGTTAGGAGVAVYTVI